MNTPEVSDQDYINLLIATPKACSGTEAARVQPEQSAVLAHDAFTRLLHRLEPDAVTLWHEAAGQVERRSGLLVVDDSTLDKPYAKKIDLVQRHWSGKHHAVVKGINLISLLWTEGDRHVPVDYRLYDKAGDGLTTPDHFQALLKTAHPRGVVPECVVFDSWDGSLANFEGDRRLGLGLADSAEGQPPGQPGPPRLVRGGAGRDRRYRHPRPSERLRTDSRVQACHPRRRP